MDIKKQLIKLQGKDYLPVASRIVAFREQHGAGVITTELVFTEPVVVVRATVHSGEGVLLATGYGTAPLAGKGSYAGRGIEKAETAAIGRALAHAGFGTLYAQDADDSDNLADAPVETPRQNGSGKVTPLAAPAASGWTREQANCLITEARALHVSDDELLALLDVQRISEYAPGLTAASEALKQYVKARPANPAPLPGDLFGGNGGAA